MMRQILTLMMVIIILPWGAYARAADAAQRAPAVTMVAAPTPSAPYLGQAEAPDQSWLAAPRNCRTATLPGFPCGADPATLPATERSFWPDLKAGFLAAADWNARGRADPPPREPPRPV